MRRYRRESIDDTGASDASPYSLSETDVRRGPSIIEEVRAKVRKDPRFKRLMDLAITRSFSREMEHVQDIPPPEHPEPRGPITGLTRAQLLAALGQPEDRV